MATTIYGGRQRVEITKQINSVEYGRNLQGKISPENIPRTSGGRLLDPP